MHVAFTSCNSTNNNHFLHHKKSFSARTVILAPSRLSVIASSAVWVKGLRGEEVVGGNWRGEPNGGSILIKDLGSELWIKIATKGDWHRFLQALTAQLTAALPRRAVEPSRESARLPMMRWDGEITSDKPSTHHPTLITLLHTNTHRHTLRKSNYHLHACAHTHTHTHSRTHLPASWASNGTLADWASTCPVSPARSMLMCSRTYKIPVDVPQQSAATVLSEGNLTKLSPISKQKPNIRQISWPQVSVTFFFTADHEVH